MKTKVIQLCPRRAEVPNAESRFPKEDTWDIRDNFRACSFCGSMHPEDLLNLLANGCSISPTDKNYKIYVSPGVVAQSRREGKFYFQHFNEAQMVRFIELYNTKPRPFIIGYPGDFYVLPFFVRKSQGGE